MKHPHQLKRTNPADLNYYSGTSVIISDIDRCLRDLIKPINKGKEQQDRIIKHIYALLDDWYRITKQCLKAGDIVSDGAGILSNQTMYSSEKFLKANPYVKLIPLYIQKLIDNDEDPIMTTSTNTSNVVTMPKATPVDTTAADIEWNKPFIEAIEKHLSEMNEIDVQDKAAIKTAKSQLKSLVRKWVDASYKSILDIENDDRLKTDVAGVLAGKTIFSSPQYVELYDYSADVDAIIETVAAKHKTKVASNEVTAHTMAEAISKAQDESTTDFEVPTGDGESVAVNKKTGDVTIKKDGFVVRTAKAAYEGVKNFFKMILAKVKQFGAWVKSWFVSKEEPRVMTKEEADEYDAAVKAQEQALAS